MNQLTLRRARLIQVVPFQEFCIELFLLNNTESEIKDVNIMEFIDNRMSFVRSQSGFFHDNMVEFSPQTFAPLRKISPGRELWLSYVLRAPDARKACDEQVFPIKSKVKFGNKQGEEVLSMPCAAKVILAFPKVKTDVTVKKILFEKDRNNEKLEIIMHSKSIGKINPTRIRYRLKLSPGIKLEETTYALRPTVGFLLNLSEFERGKYKMKIITDYWDPIGNEYSTSLPFAINLK
jgi:hypothetical protein